MVHRNIGPLGHMFFTLAIFAVLSHLQSKSLVLILLLLDVRLAVVFYYLGRRGAGNQGSSRRKRVREETEQDMMESRMSRRARGRGDQE